MHQKERVTDLVVAFETTTDGHHSHFTLTLLLKVYTNRKIKEAQLENKNLIVMEQINVE